LRVLVTGGAGFIGSEFVRSALSNKFDTLDLDISKLTVVDSLTYAANMESLNEVANNSKFDFVQGDIRNSTLIEKLVLNSDLVVNFAAESHVDRSIENANDFVTTNVMGVFNILEAVKKKMGVRFIQISTDEVYGSIKNGSFTEKSNLRPSSPYSASKASADLLSISYFTTHNLNISITRSSNNYGRFQNKEKFIPKIITEALKGNSLPIYGNGKNKRQWVHVSDNVFGVAVVCAKGKAGEIYNIGSGNEISNKKLAKFILNLSPNKLSEIEFVEDRKGHDFRYSIKDTKLSKLGYAPKVKFINGIKDTISFYSSQSN
jgi:dTDP-glucose 4,6-dehydratase